jgi:hypothetical protein
MPLVRSVTFPESFGSESGSRAERQRYTTGQLAPRDTYTGGHHVAKAPGAAYGMTARFAMRDAAQVATTPNELRWPAWSLFGCGIPCPTLPKDAQWLLSHVA